MIRVTNAEDALSVARELCARHAGILEAAGGSSADAREAALRIVMAELARPGSVTPARNRSAGGADALSPFSPQRPLSSPPPATSAASGPASSPLLSRGPRGERSAPRSPTGSEEPPASLGDRRSVGSAGSFRRSGTLGRSGECYYCDEPSSRFCKETGRRHETVEQRTKRMWRTMYRQMALAASFVSTARLAKVNTCVEEYAVHLDLDDF